MFSDHYLHGGDKYMHSPDPGLLKCVFIVKLSNNQKRCSQKSTPVGFEIILQLQYEAYRNKNSYFITSESVHTR